MATDFFEFRQRKSQILRGPHFSKFQDRGIMEKFLDWLWTPLVALFAFLYQKTHRNSTNIEILIQSQEALADQLQHMEHSRERIFDKMETVRKELSQQHSTLRSEQRADMKEIREYLTQLNCKKGSL